MPFVETLIRELAEALRQAGLQKVKVVRSDSSVGSEPSDLQWYCGRPNLESEGHFFLGASPETWEEIGGTSASWLGPCLDRAFAGHAEAQQLVASTGSSEAPPRDWSRIDLEILHGGDARLPLCCVMSPSLEAALDDAKSTASTPAASSSAAKTPIANLETWLPPGSNAAAELLAHVQVPVSVSFGGTQIRLKELLNLSTGSVVELDQALSDSVEIRVNHCLIARGEVVAVDGHYGVRVLEMVSAGANVERGVRR